MPKNRVQLLAPFAFATLAVVAPIVAPIVALAGCSIDVSTGTTADADVGASPDVGSEAAPAVDAAIDTTPEPAIDSAADDASSAADTATEATADGADDADDASPELDAASDAAADAPSDAAPLGFCASQTGLAFCDDFDDPALSAPDATKWDFLEPVTPPVLTLSTAQARSGARSLLADFPGEPAAYGLRFAKTLPSSTFTEATWRFAVRVEALPANVGFFLVDYQFTDDGGPDRFGFRVVAFSDGDGKIKEARIEHNHPVLGGGDDFEPWLPAGAIKEGAWTQVEMRAKFTFAAEGNTVTFRLTLDDASTPVLEKTYPAPDRSKIGFARIAGLPALFQKTAGHRIHFDDVTVRLQ